MAITLTLTFFLRVEKWPQISSFWSKKFTVPTLLMTSNNKGRNIFDLKWCAYFANEIWTKFSAKLHNREILEKLLETLNIFVLLNIFDQKSSFRGHFQIFSWSFVVIQLNNRQPIRIARLVKNSFFLRTSPEHEILNFLVKFFVREWKNHLLWVE